MDYEVRETAFTHPCVLCSPAEAYDAVEEAEKARVRKLVKADDIYNPELANSVRHFKDEEGEKNMCSSVKAYCDEKVAEARAEARAETAKEYQMEIEKLKAELAKYQSAEKRN